MGESAAVTLTERGRNDRGTTKCELPRAEKELQGKNPKQTTQSMSGRNDSSRFAARSLFGRLSLWADKKPGWAMRRGALKRGESRTLQPNPGGLFGRRFFVGRHKAPQGFIRRRIIPSESCRSIVGRNGECESGI